MILKKVIHQRLTMLFLVLAVLSGFFLTSGLSFSQDSSKVDYAWLAREMGILGSNPTSSQVQSFLSALEQSSGGRSAIKVLKEFKTDTEKTSTGKEKWKEFAPSEQGIMSVIRDTLLSSVAENLKTRAKKGLLGSAVAIGYSGKWTIKTKEELTFDSDFDASLFAEIMGDSNPFKSENILSEIERDVSRKLGVAKAENLSIVLTGSGFEAIADVYISSGGKKWAVRESMNRLYLIEPDGSIKDISHIPESLFTTMYERLLARYYPQLADQATGKLRKGLSREEIQQAIAVSGDKIPGTYKIFKEGSTFTRQDAATAALDMIFHTSEVSDATTAEEAFAKIAKQAARSSEVFIEGMRTAPIWNNNKFLTAEDRALMRALADYEKGKIKLSALKRSFALERAKLPANPEDWTRGQADHLQAILNQMEAAAIEFRTRTGPVESMMDLNDKKQSKFRDRMIELMKKQAIAAHFYHIQEIISVPPERRAAALHDFYKELKNISDYYGNKGIAGDVMDWVNQSVLEVEIMYEMASRHPRAYEALIKLLKSKPEARKKVIGLLKETEMGQRVLERTGKLLEAPEKAPLLGEPEPGIWNSMSNFIREYVDAHSFRTQGPAFIIAWAGDLAMTASMVDLAMNARDNKEVAVGVVHSIVTFWPPAMIIGALGQAYAMPQGTDKLKAYEKALLMLFIPEIILPDMVGAIGNTIANIAATLSFDNQLDALYFLSTPQGFNKEGALLKLGDEPQWSAAVTREQFPSKIPPFPKLNINVDEDPRGSNMNDFYYWLFVQEGGNKELQDMISRAALKARGLIGETAGGVNVFMKLTVRRVVRETIINGNVGIFKEDGPLATAAANIRKYDQSIIDFANAFSFSLPQEGKWAERTGVKPGDFGSFENLTIPDWASKLDKAQVRALAHMYWNREKWRIKAKEAFLDAVVRTLEIRERAEREIKDKKYKPLLEELQKLFKNLQISDAGNAAFENAAGYNILAKTWSAIFGADATHGRQLKMQKALDAFLDAYRNVIKIRKAIEDTALSHTGEGLSPRPLTGEIPLLSEPSIDLNMAGNFAGSFQELGKIRKNLEFIKKAKLDGEFDSTIFRNIYRCEYSQIYFGQLKDSAGYLQKNKVYAWEYFAKRDISEIIQNADTQLSIAKKTCPDLWQKFRDAYGDEMEFQVEIIAPQEIQEGQNFDGSVRVSTRPKVKAGEGIKPMNEVPEAIAKQLRYSWIIGGKTIQTGATPSLKIKSDKEGEYTLTVIVSRIDTRQASGKLFEVGRRDAKIKVTAAKKDRDKPDKKKDDFFDNKKDDFKDGKKDDVKDDKKDDVKDDKKDDVKKMQVCTYDTHIYGEWSECRRSTKKLAYGEPAGIQTRRVTGRKTENCIEKRNPVLEQGCTPPPSEEEKKNKYLNCLCRCYCGWAGHIGVWYDPEGKSIPESPSTGPCFGGAGAFGNTRRHHFGAPNDCAKSCWEGAYGKDTYDPTRADRIRKEENKKHLKPLVVKIKPSKNPADFGDIINLTAETSEGTGGYAWRWGGCAQDGKDNTAKVVNTRSCSSCAASVTATDQDGNSASDSVTIKCNAMKVKLTKESPKENKLPIGSKATFLAEVLSGDKPANGTFNYIWERNPDALFGDDPKNPKYETQGGSQSRNTARFGKIGTTPVWVSVLKEVDGRKTTIGESEQIMIEVSNPRITLTANKKTPLIGETVVITVKEEPAMSNDIISFWWEIKGAATNPGPVPNIPNNRSYSFKPKDSKPVTITVHGKAKDGGTDLGSADMVITARAYEISISEPGYLESPPEIWQCDTQLGRAQSCGMIKVKPNQFAVFRDVFMKANITPQPESPRFKWTVNPTGSCGLPGSGSEIKINCSNTGTYNAKVEVSNADGTKLGEATQSVTISISREQMEGSKKGKDGYDKLQKAKELVAQGKLDEAISLADEAAKLDQKNVEAKNLFEQWRKDRDSISLHMSNMKKLIQAEKITEAEKEIAEAKRLHPKYPPVIEAEKILKDGKDKKANKDAALAKERTNRDAADRLWNEGTALYNQKKMGEALIKFKESLKSLGTPERVKFVQDLEAGFAKDKANKDAADKLWNEGTALYNQKKMGEALVKFKESLKSLGTPERIKYVQDLEAGLAKDKAAKDAILAKDKANKDAADKLWNEGAALYNQKKMGEALIKFKESIKSLSTPEKVKYVQDLEAKTGQTKIQCQRLNDEGAQLQASGKFKESLIKYTDYQKLCPSPEIENHIKQIQAKIKESEEKEGKKVIAKKLRDEATVLQQQNRLKEAIARYRESLTYLPDPDLEKHVKQLEIKAATPASAQIPAASSVNTPRPVDKTPPKSKVIFENGNTGSVQNNPNCNPAFSITAPHRITLIWNYHWNNGKGVPAGTISLKKQDGTVYGPWQTSTGTGQSNAPNVNWTASPNITIPAGTYTVIDSNPNTWSQNSQSKGCGFTKVEGFVN